MALVGQRYLMAIGGNDGKLLNHLLSTSGAHHVDLSKIVKKRREKYI